MLPAHLLTSALVLAGFLLVFDLATLTSARYLVPLMGMVLGNILRSNVVALDRFFSELRAGEDMHIQYLTLGASPSEAVRPLCATPSARPWDRNWEPSPPWASSPCRA